MTIRPLSNQVLVGPLPMQPTKSAGGVHYAPQYAPAEDKIFYVIAVGPKVKEVVAGDRVVVEMLGRNRKPIDDGTRRVIIDDREIVAVILSPAKSASAAQQ